MAEREGGMPVSPKDFRTGKAAAAYAREIADRHDHMMKIEHLRGSRIWTVSAAGKMPPLPLEGSE